MAVNQNLELSPQKKVGIYTFFEPLGDQNFEYLIACVRDVRMDLEKVTANVHERSILYVYFIIIYVSSPISRQAFVKKPLKYWLEPTNKHCEIKMQFLALLNLKYKNVYVYIIYVIHALSAEGS